MCRILALPETEPDLTEWTELVRSVDGGHLPGAHRHHRQVRHACPTPTCRWSSRSTTPGFHHGADVEIEWIQAEDVEGLLAAGRLKDLDGIVIPGGFGERGIEGKIAAAGYAREHGVPCLGICLGMQVMTVEFARNVLGLAGANSTEFDPSTPHPVIDLMDSQRDVTNKGGTMRLGAYIAQLDPEFAWSPRPTARRWSPSGTGTATSSTPRTAGVSRAPASASRAPRPTVASSSSSSSTTTRTGSPPRPIPSSRAGRPTRRRCSVS